MIDVDSPKIIAVVREDTKGRVQAHYMEYTVGAE